MRPPPKLEPGRNGIVRDLAYRAGRLDALPPPVANTSNAVNAAAEKGQLEDGDRIALVTADGQIKPLSVATLKSWLESTYVLTAQP